MRSNVATFCRDTVRMVILSNSSNVQARNLWLCFVMGGRGSVISHINSESLSFIGFSIRYSQATNTMVHKCSCCQEIKTSNRRVTLTCSDGTSLDHSYSSVEKCSCEGAECITQDNTQQETRQIKTSQEQANVKN